MLSIQTFDARAGGNVLYKALAHPLAAEAAQKLAAGLAMAGPVALYDPDGIAEALAGLLPGLMGPAGPQAGIYVHDVTAIGTMRAGQSLRALVDLPASGARAVLVAAFDAKRILARIAPHVPEEAAVFSLDAIRLPPAMLTVGARYLDKLNFATNFVFFRDQAGLSTRLVSANYWAGYGAASVRLWLRLYDRAGAVLAEWEQALPESAGGFVIDSQAVRARFGLGEFTGQLLVHAIGAAGHDVVKYALDTYPSLGASGEHSLSCTHDANAWPSARYAGLPAPRADERVILWLQNSHAVPIPPGAIALDRMGAEEPAFLDEEVPPFATRALDVGTMLPGVQWPAQIEVRAARHVVRPRYEVIHAGRTRIAHVNVERADLRPDPAIAALPALLGRGFLLPFPVLPRARFRTIVQPTPMAESQRDLPLRLDIFDPEGNRRASHYLGVLARNHDVALTIEALSDIAEGHAELVYDFRNGGSADGWLHALFRYEDRQSGHAAESSFGAHIFNTAMTWRDEPQSYNGPPPGLSTRLFLRLGTEGRRSFAVLIYPASAPWQARSDTTLILHDGAGRPLAEAKRRIACSGSSMVWPHESFSEADLARAGEGGYVLIRDTTCRLFGYHGLMDDAGGFSLDHMFGF